MSSLVSHKPLNVSPQKINSSGNNDNKLFLINALRFHENNGVTNALSRLPYNELRYILVKKKCHF